MNDNYRPAVLDSIRWGKFKQVIWRIFMDNIEAELKKIISEHLGIEPNLITMEKKLFDDLGADSLDIVELVMAAEDTWHIEFADDELRAEDVSVSDFVKKIREKVVAKSEVAEAKADA